MNRLPRLPHDVQDHVYSYWNPYRDYYSKNVVSKIWEIAWKRFFRGLTGDQKIIMYYILCTWGVFKDRQISLRMEEPHKMECFPTDLIINVSSAAYMENSPFLDVYVSCFVPTSRRTVSRIIFVGIVIPFDRIGEYWTRVIKTGYARSHMIPVYDDYDQKISLYKMAGYGDGYGWGERQTGVHSYPYPY